MKNIMDYLRENKEFRGIINCKEIVMFLYNDGINDVVIVHSPEEDECYGVDLYGNGSLACRLQDLFEEYFQCEIRFCEVCGKPYDKGFMECDGDWYCCEDCFDGGMNERYGKGKWRPSEDEGAWGGWYEYLNERGEWKDTGVFYTEWN